MNLSSATLPLGDGGGDAPGSGATGSSTHVRPIPLAALERMLGIVGMTGSGKTYTAKGGVEQLLTAGRRVVIIDPLGVWWGLRLLPDAKTKSAFDIAIFGGDHGDFPIEPEQGKGVAKIVDDARMSAIIDVSGFAKEEQTEFLEGFLDQLYELNKAHRSVVYLAIDEADEFAPQTMTKEERPLFRVIDRIVRRGRILGFRVMMITQRPAALHKNVLTQCQSLIAMGLNAEQDRKAIEGWVKGQPDAAASREVVRTLGQLQTGEGWLYAPRLHIIDRGRFPVLTTFDSSSTPEPGEDHADVAVEKLDMGALADAMAKLGKDGSTPVDDRDDRIEFLQDQVADLRRQLDNSDRAVDFYARRFKEIAIVATRALEPPAGDRYPTADEESGGRRLMMVQVIPDVEGDEIIMPFSPASPYSSIQMRVDGSADQIRDRFSNVADRLAELAGIAPAEAEDEFDAAGFAARQPDAASRLIIEAIGSAAPYPLTLVQAARLAGLHPQIATDRTVDLLRSGALTPVGRDGYFTAAPSVVETLRVPRLTLRDIGDRLMNHLGGDAASMLLWLRLANKPVTRAELASGSGVISPSSSRLYTLLHELFALGLIEKQGRSLVTLTEIGRG